MKRDREIKAAPFVGELFFLAQFLVSYNKPYATSSLYFTQTLDVGTPTETLFLKDIMHILSFISLIIHSSLVAPLVIYLSS